MCFVVQLWQQVPGPDEIVWTASCSRIALLLSYGSH